VAAADKFLEGWASPMQLAWERTEGNNNRVFFLNFSPIFNSFAFLLTPFWKLILTGHAF